MSDLSTSDTEKINRGKQQLSQPPQSVESHQSAIQAEQERLQKALARRMAEHASTSATNRLPGRTLDSGRNGWLPNLIRSGGAGDYVVLPAHLASKVDLSTCPRWRIELHGLGSTAPIGFDLVGDVVLGRSKDGPSAPDVDLDHLEAQKMGVSRRHVILRPTEKHLYLIDLNSTNGTMHNGLPVGPGVARSVQHNDAIMLGDLTFTLKIVARPGVPVQSLTPQAAAYADIVKIEAARREATNANGNQPNATVQMGVVARSFNSMQQSPTSMEMPARPITSMPSPSLNQQLQSDPATPNPAAAMPAPAAPVQEPLKMLPAPPAKVMGLRARLMGKK